MSPQTCGTVVGPDVPQTHGPRTRCLPSARGQDVPRTHGPRTRCLLSEQDVPPPGGEMDCQTLTLQQIVDTQLALLRTIAAFISQCICTNSKTMCSLPETLLCKAVGELG